MLQWLVDEVSHQVGDGGYVCRVTLERGERMHDSDMPAFQEMKPTFEND